MASRRSERARITQPAPPGPAHSVSSSSASSNRAERVTRSNNKHNSSNKSSTPRSLSSDDIEDASRGHQTEPPQTRLRAREQDNEDFDSTKLEEDLDDAGSEEPEEEITRCICGHQEWPGPALITGDPENDEGGGFFIQCDVCKVWQHGGCIGLPEDLVPDSYFCEECKPQLHRLFVNPQGQKYSWYLDVPSEIKQYRDRLEREKDKAKSSARKTSVPKEVEDKSKEREKVMRSATEALKKRRSTMNSRAALDDDEVLRKVLEESKTDAGVPPSDTTTTRKGKRSRDDSEEISQESKRPRTGSRSRSSSPTIQDEKESIARNNGITKGKPRGAAARSQREKEMREEKERERAEAAGRRKGRAERRRAEDTSMPESEDIVVDDVPQQTETVEAETPDTPSGTASATQVVKKSGRPPQKRANRGGRNQQTRDTSTPNAGSPGRNIDNSPLSPSGRVNGDNSGNASDGTTGKPGKSRNWKLEKMSWNDIKKPAAAMLNYIQARQVEMADKTGITAMVMSMSPGTVSGTKDTKPLGDSTPNADEEDELDKFKKLNPLEMMDHLSRDIELWNQTV